MEDVFIVPYIGNFGITWNYLIVYENYISLEFVYTPQKMVVFIWTKGDLSDTVESMGVFEVPFFQNAYG